jgi:hypothetical protein
MQFVSLRAAETLESTMAKNAMMGTVSMRMLVEPIAQKPAVEMAWFVSTSKTRKMRLMRNVMTVMMPMWMSVSTTAGRLDVETVCFEMT